MFANISPKQDDPASISWIGSLVSPIRNPSALMHFPHLSLNLFILCHFFTLLADKNARLCFF